MSVPAADPAFEVPQAVADYLVEIALEDHDFAYLQVTAKGHLLSSGGNLQKYGLAAIAPGEYVGEAFYYLEGFFPIERTEVMQHLQLDCGPVVDIHIVQACENKGDGWVLLLDTTEEAQRIQRLQQKGNDLSLLRQQYTKLLNQHLTPSQQSAKIIDSGAIAHQTISVLVIKFCGPQTDPLSIGKPSILKAVNASLSFIMQVIVEEGGLINHVLGGTAAAFFGLLPSQQSAPQQAVYAAQRILKQLMAAPHLALSPLQNLAPSNGETFEHSQSEPLGFGASITSGEAAAGVLHSPGYQQLNAVGDPIHAAAQMNHYIQPGTIILDCATFEAVQPYQSGFQILRIAPSSISGIDSNMTLYRIKFK